MEIRRFEKVMNNDFKGVEIDAVQIDVKSIVCSKHYCCESVPFCGQKTNPALFCFNFDLSMLSPPKL